MAHGAKPCSRTWLKGNLGHLWYVMFRVTYFKALKTWKGLVIKTKFLDNRKCWALTTGNTFHASFYWCFLNFVVVEASSFIFAPQDFTDIFNFWLHSLLFQAELCRTCPTFLVSQVPITASFLLLEMEILDLHTLSKMWHTIDFYSGMPTFSALLCFFQVNSQHLFCFFGPLWSACCCLNCSMYYSPLLVLLAREVHPDPQAGDSEEGPISFPSSAVRGRTCMCGLSAPALPTCDPPTCPGWDFPTPSQPLLPPWPLSLSWLPPVFTAHCSHPLLPGICSKKRDRHPKVLPAPRAPWR